MYLRWRFLKMYFLKIFGLNHSMPHPAYLTFIPRVIRCLYSLPSLYPLSVFVKHSPWCRVEVMDQGRMALFSVVFWNVPFFLALALIFVLPNAHSPRHLNLPLLPSFMFKSWPLNILPDQGFLLLKMSSFAAHVIRPHHVPPGGNI